MDQVKKGCSRLAIERVDSNRLDLLWAESGVGVPGPLWSTSVFGAPFVWGLGGPMSGSTEPTLSRSRWMGLRSAVEGRFGPVSLFPVFSSTAVCTVHGLGLQASTLEKTFKCIIDRKVETAEWKMTAQEVSDWIDTMAKRLRNLLHDTHVAATKKKTIPKWMLVLPWLKAMKCDEDEVGGVACSSFQSTRSR